MSRDRSPSSLVSALKKLHDRTTPNAPGGQVAHTGKCFPCQIGNVPVAVSSELVPIQAHLSSLQWVVRSTLTARAEEYRTRTAPFRDDRLAEAKIDCPFATPRGCLIHDVRPFGCRLTGNAGTDRDTRALAFGHMLGLRLSNLDHTQVELGLVLEALLEDPTLAERYMAGERVAWDAAVIPPGRDVISEHIFAFKGEREPTGFPVDLPSVANCQEAIRESDFDNAVSMLHGSSALEQLYRIQVPYACESEDQITEWQEYLSNTVREVSQLRFDPSEAFDALKALPMYSLAFQGRDVKPMLSNVARSIIEPIVTRALPDLVRPLEGPRKPGPIRVGYLSRNIRSGSAATWALGWIEHHGPEIESYVFSTSDVQDKGNLRFRAVADHYYHVPGDVPSTARFIRSLDLDVMIFTDLGQVSWNYMYAGMRLARVQCTAWGFPVTSGLSTIDYFLSSELMEPKRAENHYVEKLVRLPGSGLYLEPTEFRKATKTRADFGLPEGFLIGMLQNVMKCVPKWDYLLREINEATGAKIYFAEHYYPGVTRKLKARFERAGIKAEWIPRMPLADFHEMIQLFDVLIDTPAWSGGITTLDTLPYGKPVITLPGEFMRGRLSLAFLTQSNLGSLIADSPTDFVKLVSSSEIHQQALEGADLQGAYRDAGACAAINAWLLSTVEGL